MSKSKFLSIIIIASAVTSLAACVFKSDSSHISQVSQRKLDSGKEVRVGYMQPVAAWECKKAGAQQKYSWAKKTIEGSFGMSSPFRKLENKAINYANTKRLNTNYIALYVPRETQIGNYSTAYHTDATADFYNCKQPPKVKDSLF